MTQSKLVLYPWIVDLLSYDFNSMDTGWTSSYTWVLSPKGSSTCVTYLSPGTASDLMVAQNLHLRDIGHTVDGLEVTPPI